MGAEWVTAGKEVLDGWAEGEAQANEDTKHGHGVLGLIEATTPGVGYLHHKIDEDMKGMEGAADGLASADSSDDASSDDGWAADASYDAGASAYDDGGYSSDGATDADASDEADAVSA
jgi:hypothetical protein